MPFTFPQAIEIANRQLSSGSDGGVALELVTDKTEEFDIGWVFYYQAASFISTGDIRTSVVGNAPLFVSRSDGLSFFVGYHRPLSESMAAYRACGNQTLKRFLRFVLPDGAKVL